MSRTLQAEGARTRPPTFAAGQRRDQPVVVSGSVLASLTPTQIERRLGSRSDENRPATPKAAGRRDEQRGHAGRLRRRRPATGGGFVAWAVAARGAAAACGASSAASLARPGAVRTTTRVSGVVRWTAAAGRSRSGGSRSALPGCQSGRAPPRSRRRQRAGRHDHELVPHRISSPQQQSHPRAAVVGAVRSLTSRLARRSAADCASRSIAAAPSETATRRIGAALKSASRVYSSTGGGRSGRPWWDAPLPCMAEVCRLHLPHQPDPWRDWRRRRTNWSPGRGPPVSQWLGRWRVMSGGAVVRLGGSMTSSNQVIKPGGARRRAVHRHRERGPWCAGDHTRTRRTTLV